MYYGSGSTNGVMQESSNEASSVDDDRVTLTKARERRSSLRARVAIDTTTCAQTSQYSSVLKADDDDDDDEMNSLKSLSTRRRQRNDDKTHGITCSLRHVTSDVTGTQLRHSTPIRVTPATVSAPDLSGNFIQGLLCDTKLGAFPLPSP